MTLDEAIKRYTSDAFYEKTDGNLQRCLEFEQLVEWLKKLKQLREQTRWIPVSERLPNRDEYIKNNGLFNVSDGNRSYSEWFDIYDKQMFGEPTMSGFRVDYAVTAWMPLPESYHEMTRQEEIEHAKTKQLLDELSKMSPMVINTAYLYAINYITYGVDVTEKWLTATENAANIERAYKDGYYDALKRMKSEVSDTHRNINMEK